MAKTRLELSKKLKTICQNCYFSPPNGFNMNYPCIVYTWDNNSIDNADNTRYIGFRRYTVTVITDDPDSDLSDKLLECFRYCSLNRHFTSDNLNHFVHTLYF